MIISEKQVMQLMTIALGAAHLLNSKNMHEDAKNIGSLIDEINNQQSDELKEIE